MATRGSSFISFTKFWWIFFQTHNFLREQTRQHNPTPVKKYIVVSYGLPMYKKDNNFETFHLEASTRSCPGNGCPMNYQFFYEKHPSSSINFIEYYFQRQFS